MGYNPTFRAEPYVLGFEVVAVIEPSGDVKPDPEVAERLAAEKDPVVHCFPPVHGVPRLTR